MSETRRKISNECPKNKDRQFPSSIAKIPANRIKYLAAYAPQWYQRFGKEIATIIGACLELTRQSLAIGSKAVWRFPQLRFNNRKTLALCDFIDNLSDIFSRRIFID